MDANEEDTIMDSAEKLRLAVAKSKSNPEEAIHNYLKKVNFPAVNDFKIGLEWFNVSEPLNFDKHLKGKVVLLDFFTYCCINCMHILPDLKELEDEFTIEDGFVVVGVHSPKFENEKDSNNILSAVQRYKIAHPVINDNTNDMWTKCQVHCWPTCLLLGPDAKPLVMLMGEGHKSKLKLYVKATLSYYKTKNLISNHPLPMDPANRLLPTAKGALLFPGKVASFLENGMETLAVSDSGNSRVLIIQDGKILKEIGAGIMGFKDGSLETAQFNQPQGLVFKSADVLYVADTENHAVREIDLADGIVTTVAGNGVQSSDKTGGQIGQEQGISSPWDVCMYKTTDWNVSEGSMKEVLLIAMAGTHQIWALFLDDTLWWKNKLYERGTVTCIAGSGKEENKNNQYPNNAAFAQPSGLAISQQRKELYIADSESSSIRKLNMLDGKVSAIVGGDRDPNNLFAFGDKDGTSYEAKLQHSLGLTLSADENKLIVADTYNHKIKKIDISSNKIVTLEQTGDNTDSKQHRLFNEPAGLCRSLSNDSYYVADTNNHCIKVITLDDCNNIQSVTNLQLQRAGNMNKNKLGVIMAKQLHVSKTGGDIHLKVLFALDEPLHFSQHFDHKWVSLVSEEGWLCNPDHGNDVEDTSLVLRCPANQSNNGGHVDLMFQIVVCSEDACLPKNFILRQQISFTKHGKKMIEQSIKIRLTVAGVSID